MSTANRVHRRRISEILIDEGLVSKEQIDEALIIQARTKENLGAILVDMGVINETDVVKTIVTQFQLPFIRLANYQVDEKLVELLPAEFLHRHGLLPFDRIGSMLLCAVTEVPDEQILSEIPRTTRNSVALYVGTLSEVNAILQRLCPTANVKAPAPQRSQAGSPGTESQAPVRPAASAPAKSSSGSTVKPKASSNPALKSSAAPIGPAEARKVFGEESSEALLQAIDSTWESIFDSMDTPAATDGGEPPADVTKVANEVNEFFEGLA